MKRYDVVYTPAAHKSLQKMDRQIAGMIYAWIENNLVGCSDPRVFGKPLSANRVGQWRYRIGDYRLIAQIHDEGITILMLAVGHRGAIYGRS